MNTCSDDIFWIIIWVAISFFSHAALDLIYKIIGHFNKVDTIGEHLVITLIAFAILFTLIRIYEIDLSRKKQDDK